MFDVASRIASSTRHHTADGEPIGDCILPTSPRLFVQVDLTLLTTIQTHVHLWLSEYHLPEVPGSEGPKAPEGGDSDV